MRRRDPKWHCGGAVVWLPPFVVIPGRGAPTLGCHCWAQLGRDDELKGAHPPTVIAGLDPAIHEAVLP